MREKTLRIAYTALCAAVFVVCSWIAVPSSPPFTLQTLAVFTAVGTFGVKVSLSAYSVYLTLGSVGLPVFAGFNGGLHVVLGPTGGFLFGFLLAIIVCGIMITFLGDRVVFIALSMGAGLVITYLTGAMLYAACWLGGITESSVKVALLQCVVPFVIPDILKISVAIYITKNLKGRARI